MITLKTLLITQTLIIDAQTNSTSAINLVEEITVFAFPAALPPFTVFALLERDLADAPQRQARVVIEHAANQIAAIDVGLNFLNFKRTRGMFRVEGLIVPGPGPLSARLEESGLTLGTYSFDINVGVAIPAHSAPPSSRGPVN